jgi:hypothetical protein
MKAGRFIGDEALVVAEKLQPDVPPVHFFGQGAGYPVGHADQWTSIGRSSFATMQQKAPPLHTRNSTAPNPPNSKIHVKAKTGESKSDGGQ